LSKTKRSEEAPEQEKEFGRKKRAREYQSTPESSEVGGGICRFPSRKSLAWRRFRKRKRKEIEEGFEGVL
jgi:hypothetical protein